MRVSDAKEIVRRLSARHSGTPAGDARNAMFDKMFEANQCLWTLEGGTTDAEARSAIERLQELDSFLTTTAATAPTIPATTAATAPTATTATMPYDEVVRRVDAMSKRRGLTPGELAEFDRLCRRAKRGY